MIEERVMVLRVQEEEYALPMSEIKGTIRCRQKINKPAEASDYVEGIININGELVPIVRLSTKIGLLGGKKDLMPVIIIELRSQQIGLVVDEIVDELLLPVAHIEPSVLGCGFPGSCITGFGKIDNRLIVLLEATLIFSDDEIARIKSAKDLTIIEAV